MHAVLPLLTVYVFFLGLVAFARQVGRVVGWCLSVFRVFRKIDV